MFVCEHYKCQIFVLFLSEFVFSHFLHHHTWITEFLGRFFFCSRIIIIGFLTFFWWNRCIYKKIIITVWWLGSLFLFFSVKNFQGKKAKENFRKMWIKSWSEILQIFRLFSFYSVNPLLNSHPKMINWFIEMDSLHRFMFYS